jgi:SAM-dependent methyltransferase
MKNIINRCRICNHESLVDILTLFQMPFTDEFLSVDMINSEYKSDIKIGFCKNCGISQNLTNTNMDIYYNEYTYSVQSSNFAMEFMKKLSRKIKDNYFNNQKTYKVLEIGSGSGEQLLEFKNLGFEVIGFEPSQKLSEFANNNLILTLNEFFDENSLMKLPSNFEKVDLVISSYTFDHIPNPVDILKNVRQILNDNGKLVLEIHDLDLIVKRNEYCLFEHEHYIYLNERTLTYLLNILGFNVLTFNLLYEKEKRGNSLLVVAEKVDNIQINNLNIDTEYENLNKLSDNVFTSISKLEQFLETNKDKKIVAYGAGGRGIMTLSALKNSSLIKFIVDKNPKGDDIFSPKTHIPVYNISKLNEYKPDIIIIFSFGYFNEIVNELEIEYKIDPSKVISLLSIN